ncbi:hypothetical protein KI387_012147, partial [Taxus chinensis]
AEADLGRVIGERDTALQVALTSRDADLIRDATRLGGEALFYRTAYYRVVPPEQRVALPQLSGSSASGSRSRRSGHSTRSVRQPLPEQPARPAPSQPPVFRRPDDRSGSPGEGESCG